MLSVTKMLNLRCLYNVSSKSVLLNRSIQHICRNHVHNAPSEVAKDSTSTTDRPKHEYRITNIYSGALAKNVFVVKTFSLTTSIFTLGAQPVVYPKVIELGSSPAFYAIYSVLGFFTFVTPFLLHYITKKYVTSIDFDEQKEIYTAKTISFFLLPKELEFSANDVVTPDVPGAFTTFIIKNKPLFVDLRQFKSPEHLQKWMGYDKPLNLRLKNIVSNDVAEKND